MDRDVDMDSAVGRDGDVGAGLWGVRGAGGLALTILHYIYSCAFWILLILALVLASTGVESKFIYTDF